MSRIINACKRRRDHNEGDLPSPSRRLLSSATTDRKAVVSNEPRITHGDFESDHVEATNSGREVPVVHYSVPQVMAPKQEHGPWSGLQLFLKVLQNSSHDFTPLKSAFNELLKCSSVFEGQFQAQKGYAQLRDDLDKLFRSLVLYFGEDVPPAMTPVISSLARGIEEEARLVIQKEGRNMLGRYAEAKEDADEVMGCYRRIQVLLERLTLNSNLNVWRIVDEQAADARIRRLPCSSAAKYNSAESDNLRRTACTPNTRIDVLHQIEEWASDEAGRKVYWLNGMAGTGKTTIAYSLCEQLASTRKLAASFFCTRQLPTCRDVNRILPSIAYQLSLLSHPFRHALSSVLQRDPDSYNQPLSEQLKSLVATPLQNVEQTFPLDLVVVIDALDECEDDDGVGRMLKVLLAQAANLPVKFFVTSRPESKILDQMRSKRSRHMRSELRLHELDQLIVQMDIKTYLMAELGERLSISDIDELARRSGVLFIYAATVVRYIGYDNFSRCKKRLDQILGTLQLQLEGGSRDIDTLYKTILEAAFEDDYLAPQEKNEMILVLRTVIWTQEPLTVESLAVLLGLEYTRSIKTALRSLRSVLQVSNESGLVAALHESFPDFMMDQKRSGKYSCDVQRDNEYLVQRCFDLIKIPSPPFNICELESSFLFDDQVPELDSKIRRTISQELWYACRYWAIHLEHAGLTIKLANELEHWLSVRFLLWLEIMNLKRCIYEGVGLLQQLLEWLEKTRFSDSLGREALDCWKFAIAFALSPVSRSTPHIYVSALPFWPENRPVSLRYRSRFRGLIRVAGSAMTQRRAQIVLYHTHGTVNCLAHSPRGRYIASGSDDRVLRIWDPQTGRIVTRSLEGHTRPINSIAWSPDGANIISGSDDCTIRIWDAHTGSAFGHPLKGHTNAVSSVAYLRDGAYIVSGSHDGTIRIWDSRTRQQVGKEFLGHTGQVHSVACLPGGAYIISGSDDCTVRIWSVHTGRVVGRPLEGHTYPVNSVACSPDGSQIASGSDDCTVYIWDTHMEDVEPFLKNSPSRRLVGHEASVRSVVYSHDSLYIASGSDDNTVRIWKVENIRDECILLLQGHMDLVRSVVFSPKSAYIVSGSDDHTARCWDTNTGQMVSESLTASSTTNQYHATSYNSFVGQLHDTIYDQELTWPLEEDTDLIDFVRNSSESAKHIIKTYDRRLSSQLFTSHINPVSSISYSPCGAYIASGSDNGAVHIWDIQTGHSVQSQPDGHTWTVSSIAYSPEGSRIVSGSYDGTVRIWDALTAEIVGQPLQGHTWMVNSVTYSPDGTHVASGAHDCTIRIWDALTGVLVGRPFKSHSKVSSIVYSPDGAYIISGSSECTVRVWNMRTGQAVRRPLEGHTGSVNSVACSPDGSQIVSGSDDCTLCLWDIRMRQHSGRLLEGHEGSVRSIAYSSSGKYIVSGSDDQTVRIWDVRTGRSIGRQMKGHTREVRSVACSPVGSYVASGSYDGAVRIWEARASQIENPEFDHSVDSVLGYHPSIMNRTPFSQSSCKWATSAKYGPADSIDADQPDDWTLDKHGWLISKEKRLIWIPSEVRDHLLPPRNSVLIGTKLWVGLDFSGARLGEHWRELTFSS